MYGLHLRCPFLKKLKTILNKLAKDNTLFSKSKMSKTCLSHLRFGKFMHYSNLIYLRVVPMIMCKCLGFYINKDFYGYLEYSYKVGSDSILFLKFYFNWSSTY